MSGVEPAEPGTDLVAQARALNEGRAPGGPVAIRAMAAALPFPRIRVHVATGEYYLRVGPARLDVDPAEPRGWEWLGFTPNHQCTHQRRADHQVWGPAWVDLQAVPTGVSTTHPGPMRSFGGERKGRPGTDNRSIILEPGPAPGAGPVSTQD